MANVKGKVGYRADAETGKAVRDTDKLGKSFKKTGKEGAQASKGVKKFGKASSALMGPLKAMAGLFAGGMLLRGFKNMVKGSIAAGDAMDAMSLKTGQSAVTLSEMEHVVQINKGTIEDYEKAIIRMAKNMRDYQAGLSTSVRLFDDLDVKVTNSNGTLRDSFQVFLDMADAIAKNGNATEQMALAQEAFGKGGKQLLPTLKLGREGIQGLREDAEKLGITMSEQFTKRAAEANDELTRMTSSGKALGRTLSNELLPSVIGVAKGLTFLFVKTNQAFKSWKMFISGVAPGAAQLSESLQPLRDLNDDIEATGATLDKLGGKITKLQAKQTKKGLVGTELLELKAIEAQYNRNADLQSWQIQQKGKLLFLTNDIAKAEKDAQDALDKGVGVGGGQSPRITALEDEFTIEEQNIIFLHEKRKTLAQENALERFNAEKLHHEVFLQIIDENEEKLQVKRLARIQFAADYATQLFSIAGSAFGNMLADSLVDGKKQFDDLWKSALKGAIVFTAELLIQLAIENAIMTARLTGEGAKKYGILGAIGGAGAGLGLSASNTISANRHGGGVINMHSGGLRHDEAMAVVQRGERVTRQPSVNARTEPTLDFINRTGNVPQSAGNITLTVHVDARGNDNADEIAEKVGNRLLEMSRRGEITVNENGIERAS